MSRLNLTVTLSMTPTRRFLLSSLLFAAMAAVTFTPASLGILATFIIDDLGITRAEFGIVLAVVNIAGALLSPVAGPVTDRIGGKSALVALFTIAGMTFLILGATVAYAMLFFAALVGAFAQAMGNPATNKLIAEELPAGERGVITGVKQSGVQAGIFLGGVSLPAIATALGWRGAYLLVAVTPFVAAVAALWVVPGSARRSVTRRNSERGRLPSGIGWLSAYGFLIGVSGAVTFFIPLFVEEEVGSNPIVGGFVAATIALAAIPGRIVWGRYAERNRAYKRSLAQMAYLSIAAAVLFATTAAVSPWLLWPAAVLIGIGSSSWNSVGMLAVMDGAGPAATGRASGVVMFGFLAGLGIAPPIFGATIDATGGYGAMWLMSVLTAVAAAVAILRWKMTSTSETAIGSA
ncbi:MAG: MFS transporter [Actinomycetota bacterium]